MTENAKLAEIAPRGIAILGSQPLTVERAPFDLPGWKIYACSPHNIEHRTLPKVDGWFEIHLPMQDATRSYHYLRTLEERRYPLWVRDQVSINHFPSAVMYPEEQLKREFGPFVFTSSIAFMLAKAIKDCEAEDINTIGIWGVMQASANEYTYQRPGIQQLIWEAKKRGINVMAPTVSRLFEPPAEIF